MKHSLTDNSPVKHPSLFIALLPVLVLLLLILTAVLTVGPDFVATYSWLLLIISSVAGLTVGRLHMKVGSDRFFKGFCNSARQTLPAIPILLLIGTVSATWMLSGVVPILIEYGLRYITPPLFLLTACCVCSFISLLTGSSWTTIATIGMAFMGIGELLGFSPGWVAGAVISGAYFGDKMSPLSDTTVLASSSSGVDLFRHIRYMLITTVPSIVITLAVFCVAGFMTELNNADGHHAMSEALESTFNLSPHILWIPAITFILIAMRVNTIVTLTVSTLLGLGGFFLFQPQLSAGITVAGDTSIPSGILTAAKILFTSTSLSTGDTSLDNLVATGGMAGMLPTVLLVMSAMLLGAVMFGAGYLDTITRHLTTRIRTRVAAVGATTASGLFLNGATADQYLSLIIGGNMFRNLYTRLGLEGRLLSRTLEDSVSVTSVLIPWNSCAVTQASVLGVATLTYLPYCIFNYISPLMSVLIALTGFRIRHQKPEYMTVPASVS